MNAIATEEYRGYTIELHVDDDARDPFEEFSQMGTLVLDRDAGMRVKRADIINSEYYASFAEAAKDHFEGYAIGAVLPFQLDDYGSNGWRLHIGTPGMPEENDNGLIFIGRTKLLQEYGKKIATKRIKEAARSVLRAELEEWAAWLSGEVYGYVVTGPDEDDEDSDSCWGYYGDTKFPMEEARAHVDYVVSRHASELRAAAIPGV